MAGHQSVSETGDMLPIAIRLRRLPVGITAEAVRTMLLFAQDLQDTEVVPNAYEEDRGFSTATARFATLSGATEAQMLLDGKASMIVEMLDVPIQGQGFRRSTLSTSASRPATQPTSPRSHPGRYNAQQYDIVKRGSASPPMSALPLTATGGRVGDDGQFLPKSPLSVSSKDGVRVSGKSIINQADSELDSNDHIPPIPTNMNNMDFHGHRTSTIQAPTARFQRLSLQTEGPRHSYSPGFYAPRSGIQPYSPRQSFPPVQQGGHGHQFGRGPLFPPVNPADQNPPCNTLYVGNLPMDTSEDELKAMFSKQRGYKRLCFRTKQNGPMCFVEFEDVSFATKALSDLYGAQLHNSVKGGIRLSFSKNPLGVRSGQVGSGGALSSPLVMNSPGTSQGIVPMSPGSYHAVSGPPPGLSVPPGFPAAMSAMGHYQHSGSLRSIQNTTPLHDIQFHEEYKST